MRSSHETAEPALVRVLTSEARGAIGWLEQLGCSFTRENGGYRLARCGGATRKRLLPSATGRGTPSRRRCARRKEGRATSSPTIALTELAPGDSQRLAGDVRDAGRDGRGRRRDGRPRRAAGATPRPRSAATLDEPSQRDRGRRGDRDDAGAETRDLDALQYHPNGGAWPATMQGYSIPETTRATAPSCSTPTARSSPTRSARATRSRTRSTRRSRPGGACRRGRAPGGLARHDADRARRRRVSPAYMLRRYRGGGIDPLAEPILTYPVLHYQNGGLVIDTDAETTLAGVFACGEIAGGTHGRNRMMGNHSSASSSADGPGRPPRRKRRHDDDHDDRSRPGRRGQPCAPLRLGAQGHPRGPARRARRGARPRDLRDGDPRAGPPSTATEIADEQKNLVCQDTGIAVYDTAASASTSRCTLARIYASLKAGTGAGDRRASLRSNTVHTPMRTLARTSATASRSSTGTSSRTGTAST